MQVTGQQNSNGQQATHIPWDAIEGSPQAPGLYAWYVRPSLRPADLPCASATATNLARLADQLSFPNLRITADGHLSLLFRGDLQHQHLGTREQRISEQVQYMLSDAHRRSTLATILSQSAPYLTGPLYVGVAKQLRSRLCSHKAQILSYIDLIKAGKPLDTQQRDQSLAFEIANRSIPPTQLFVSTLPVANAECLADLRQVLEACETILNRLFYPIIGRR